MRNRYVIRFTKLGYVKYTSHLDMLRVFKRAFKKAKIQLRYSEGFNPHPKLGFAQPLSLGYQSIYELLEFETMLPQNTKEVLEKLKNEMPEGISLESCTELNYDFKSLAGETVSCSYKVYIPCEMTEDEAKAQLDSYLSQSEIIALKRMKKTKKMEPVNIKDKIQKIEASRLGDFILLDMKLDGGSTSNLSPEQVISSFVEFAKLSVERYDIEVTRTNIEFDINLLF